MDLLRVDRFPVQALALLPGYFQHSHYFHCLAEFPDGCRERHFPARVVWKDANPNPVPSDCPPKVRRHFVGDLDPAAIV